MRELAIQDDPDPEPGTLRAGPTRRVQIENPNRYPEVGARRLRPWLESVVEDLCDPSVTLAVRFVSDREMSRLNREFRGKNTPTDVLSFPGGETAEGMHLGDIVISVPTARRQALGRGHAVETEVEVLLLHGVLHCLGHDHETDDGEMNRIEKHLRRRWVSR